MGGILPPPHSMAGAGTDVVGFGASPGDGDTDIGDVAADVGLRRDAGSQVASGDVRSLLEQACSRGSNALTVGVPLRLGDSGSLGLGVLLLALDVLARGRPARTASTIARSSSASVGSDAAAERGGRVPSGRSVRGLHRVAVAHTLLTGTCGQPTSSTFGSKDVSRARAGQRFLVAHPKP
jgi:hypothetical protein